MSGRWPGMPGDGRAMAGDDGRWPGDGGVDAGRRDEAAGRLTTPRALIRADRRV